MVAYHELCARMPGYNTTLHAILHAIVILHYVCTLTKRAACNITHNIA